MRNEGIFFIPVLLTIDYWASFTLLLLKHDVQIFTFFTEPLRTIRFLMIFGLKLRFVIPVILMPAPFFLLARPRVAYDLPATVPFPHISHTCAITVLRFSCINGWNIRH